MCIRDSTNDGRKVPLNYVAEVVSAMGPNTINRENVKRKIVISANVAEDVYKRQYFRFAVEISAFAPFGKLSGDYGRCRQNVWQSRGCLLYTSLEAKGWRTFHAENFLRAE